jgi:hypothetical protein
MGHRKISDVEFQGMTVIDWAFSLRWAHTTSDRRAHRVSKALCATSAEVEYSLGFELFNLQRASCLLLFGAIVLTTRQADV